MDIIINKKPALFAKSDLPMLISGQDKSGASFYTICLAANLYKAKKKIIFFCAYPMGVEEFMKQTADGDGIEYVTAKTAIAGKTAIIVKPGDEELFAWVLQNTPDVTNRIIIIKNFEVHSSAVQKTVFRDNFVISGDIDKSPEAGVLREKDFASNIFFSKPSWLDSKDWQQPEKYQAVIKGKNYSGTTALQ